MKNSTSYTPIQQKFFPTKSYKSKELRQLKKFKTDKELKISLSSCEISFASNSPSILSIFGYDNIYVYDIISDSLITKFPQISSEITTGCFRSDAKLVFTGTNNGELTAHDIINKNCLRKYQAHTLDVNCIDVNKETLVNVISSSKDCSFKLFDLSSKEPVRQFFKAHDDYIKTSKYLNNYLALTGGYDKKIKLWDTRDNGQPTVIDNGDICEDIAILSEDTFISTCANEVKLYDIRKNSFVNSSVPMQSTITKLIVTNENKRLFVQGSGENFIKCCDLSDMSLRSLFSLVMKDKISAFDVSSDMKHYSVGFVDGTVIVKSKNIPVSLEEEEKAIDFDREQRELELLDPSKYAEKTVVKNYKYFNRGQYDKNVSEDDTYLKKEKKVKLKKYDIAIKKFQYRQALDLALKERNVEMIMGVIEELIDRNGLKIALMNRTEEEFLQILKFILWKIRDVKVMGVIMYVLELLVKYYGCVIEKNEKIKETYNEIQKEIEKEIEFEKGLEHIGAEIDNLTQVYNCLN